MSIMDMDEIHTNVEEFMASPLITWFSSCLTNIITHKLTFEELIDGVFIYNVFLNMGIHGQANDVAVPDDHEQRLRNLEKIMSNMRMFYDEDSVILKEPDLRLIAREAHSNLNEVETLLILLLGCAVKCPANQHFIEKMQKLDPTTQQALATYIEKVTHYPVVVLCRDMLLFETTDLDAEETAPPTSHTKKVYQAFNEIRRINKERIELIERIENAPIPKIPHSVLELNEWKSKALHLKAIEDEYKEELEKYVDMLEAAEKENKRLTSELKLAKGYRDSVDVAAEQALLVERYEKEVSRYKNKLEHLQQFKAQASELKANNELLNESKDELLNQLENYKAKLDKTTEIEERMYKLQQQCDKLVLENESLKMKTDELNSINEELEQMVSHSSSCLKSSTMISQSEESLNTSFDKSIGEQLSRSTNAEVLKLELENRRLSQLVESLRESSFHESSFKILDLEKEKKNLELSNKDLMTKLQRLEENLASSNKEKKQLRVLLNNAQKISNGDLESRFVVLESEKRTIQRILEKTQASLKEKISALDASSKTINELQLKLQELQKRRMEDNLNTSILKSPPRSAILYNQLTNDLQSMYTEASLQNQTVEKLEQRLAVSAPADAFWKQEYDMLKKDFDILVFYYRKERSALEELMKRHDEYQREMQAKSARIVELDIECNKLEHRCEFYQQLYAQIESDKTILTDYVSQIMKHNQELVAQTREDREQYYADEKSINESLNNIVRIKERLEEKVMDHYRNMSSRQVKKRSAAAKVLRNTVIKVRRAGSDFLGLARKKSTDENSSPSDKSDEFEFMRPSDTATYVNLPRNRKSVAFLDNFEPKDFVFDDKNNNIEEEK